MRLEIKKLYFELYIYYINNICYINLIPLNTPSRGQINFYVPKNVPIQ